MQFIMILNILKSSYNKKKDALPSQAERLSYGY